MDHVLVLAGHLVNCLFGQEKGSGKYFFSKKSRGLLGQESELKRVLKRELKEASKQACKPACKQAGKQAGKQLSKQESRQTGKQARKYASKQAVKQASSQASKHLEGIKSEPCPVGACFESIPYFHGMRPGSTSANLSLDFNG